MKQLVHGGDWMGYRERFGRDALDFSANVSPLGLPEGVAQAIRDALPLADRYPDPLCRTLRAALSRAEGVPQEHILCGNGAADLIFRLVWAVKPHKALVTAPTFAEYASALDTVGCEVKRFFLDKANDFAPTDALVDAVDESIDMMFLCQPNNPTGQLASPELVKKLLRRCEAMHYGLVGLQARIQLAAAQLRFGQRADARAALAAALLDAVQDDFWVLFVEQYPALAPLLEGEDWAVCEPRLGPFVARILPAGRAFAARLGLPAPAPELPLTDRDRELARLVAGRCTNKEIAAALYLSEGTVKQYINQLYAKLDMGGDPRTRRARLAEWYQKNAPRN